MVKKFGRGFGVKDFGLIRKYGVGDSEGGIES